jgi:hypothetical protein
MSGYRRPPRGRSTTSGVQSLFRLSTLVLLSALLTAALCGCGWRGGGDVSLRNAPYPYDAALAIDDGATSQPLAYRGVVFVRSEQRVGTMGQDAMSSLVDRARQLWESLAFLYKAHEWRVASFFSNRLMEPSDDPPLSLRDDERAHAFKICAGRIPMAGTRVSDDVALQIAEAAVYELKAKGGVSIVGSSSGGPEGERGTARLSASVRDYLEGEHDAGGLYLTSLGQLLAYDFVRRNLDWSAERSSSDVTIRIRAIDDGIGTRWVPTVEELEGITFYTPDASATRIFLGGEEIRSVRANGRDRTRRESVTIVAPRAAMGAE